MMNGEFERSRCLKTVDFIFVIVYNIIKTFGGFYENR